MSPFSHFYYFKPEEMFRWFLDTHKTQSELAMHLDIDRKTLRRVIRGQKVQRKVAELITAESGIEAIREEK